MTSRDRLVALLKVHEGFVAVAYDDATGKPIGPGSLVEGHPTIGFGWCLSKRPISRVHAEHILSETLDETEHQLATRWGAYARQVDARRMALLSLAYQCGVDGLLGFVKMVRHIEDREYARARVELLDSAWARQTGAARVEAIAGMIGEGTWPEEWS